MILIALSMLDPNIIGSVIFTCLGGRLLLVVLKSFFPARFQNASGVDKCFFLYSIAGKEVVEIFIL